MAESGASQTRRHPFRDASLAFSLLTVVPLRTEWRREERSDVAGWFPLVGLVLGGAAVGVTWAVMTLAGASAGTGASAQLAWPLSLMVIVSWALGTRLLHWDGLADTADGIGGAHEPSARRAIMSDSATGAFGATAIVFVALAQVVSLAGVLASASRNPLLLYAVIGTVPVAGRLAATFSCWLGTAAKPGGLGASAMGRPRLPGAIATATVVAAIAALLLFAGGLPWLAWYSGGVFVAAVVPHLFATSVGGVTGDTMGASILVTEALLLLAASMMVVMV